MKYFFLVIAILFSYSYSIAQDLAFLRNERRVNLEFNYEEASINGYEESNILSFEKDWLVDQPKLIQKFVQAYNETGVMPVVGQFESANFTLQVRPIVISDHGNMSFYAIVLNEEGEQIYSTSMLNAKGGRFGSFLNLVGDGMKSSGRLLSGEIHRLMTKKTKRRK